MTVADLIQPIGEIEPDLFADDDPGGSTDVRVTQYLALAEVAAIGIADEAVKNQFIEAFVYAKTFRTFARQLRQVPAEQEQDSGKSKRKYSREQIASFEADAAMYQAQADALIAVVTGASTSQRPVTKAVPVEIVW